MHTIPTIEQSIIFASAAHQGQIDKIGEPYILHPIRVMLSMVTFLDRTVAILHDILEDTPFVAEDLVNRGYPPRVIAALDSVTKRKGESYMDFVARAAMDPVGLRVKLADIRDNMSPIRQFNLPPEKRTCLIKKYSEAVRYLQAKELELLE